MSRNYGLGHRNMNKAGALALERARVAKEISYETEHRYAQSWSQFTSWAKEQGINRMEHITATLVTQYGRGLADQVRAESTAASTAQNRVSAVNRVMHMATNGQWKPISPTRACGISERNHVRHDKPQALDRGAYEAQLQAVRGKVGERAFAVCELARELGLRSKEASLFDARTALKQAHKTGSVSVSDGTKGGRYRQVPITTEAQRAALERAAKAQGAASAVMPAESNWKSWRSGELRLAREAIGGLHELRAAYACERYEALTGHEAPCAGGQIHDKAADKAARQKISAELGHGRIEVVNAYVGGQR